MIRGLIKTTIILLLGLAISSAVGAWDQVAPGLPGLGTRAGQTERLTQKTPGELAPTDKPVETKKEQPAQPEQKKAPTEPIEPNPSDRLKEKPPRDFVPSEKIPADQAVDFPTDI